MFPFVVLSPSFRVVGEFKTWPTAKAIARELSLAFGERYRVLNRDWA
jgi:hypothetical protein